MHLDFYYPTSMIGRALLRLGLNVQDQYNLDEENRQKRLRGEKVVGRLTALDISNIKKAQVFLINSDQVLNHYFRESERDENGNLIPFTLRFAVPGYSVNNIEAL